jgi:ABC-type nitrate/sulfonate/bicarbonate transport system ATPase subunit
MNRLNDNYQVHIDRVSKSFVNGASRIEALKEISLVIKENEIVSIIGPSGCGKSTLVNLIAGFTSPTSGQVLIDNQPANISLKKCGTVFQEESIFPWMTVKENIEYGFSDDKTITDTTRISITNTYLDLIGLSDFSERFPKDLSGGMKKRVELARAYAFNPELLLLDEPFGSLDIITRGEMQSLLLIIWQKKRKTTVIVTHDVEEAIFLSNRVFVMTPRPGKIKEVFQVPFEMPREPFLKLSQPFLELRKKIVASLESNLNNISVN